MRTAQQKGMTLMELLVALVIGSLVILLLTTGLGTLLNHYNRLQEQMNQQQRQLLVHHWWQHTNASLVSSLDPEHHFSGQPEAFSSHTLTPLGSPPGTWVRIQWQLTEHQQQTWLTYSETGHQGQHHQWRLMPVDSDAQFYYLDPQQGWQTTWQTAQQGDQLPAALMIRVENQPPLVLAKPRVRLGPKPDYRDLL